MRPLTFHLALLLTLVSLAFTSGTKGPHNAHEHAFSTSAPNSEKPHARILDSLQHILASLKQPPPPSPPASPHHQIPFRLDPNSFSPAIADHSHVKQDLHHHEVHKHRHHKEADKPQPARPEPEAEAVAQAPAPTATH